MSKNRIQINGRWYVAEESEKDAEFDPDDLTFFRGCVLETDTSCFEFTNLTHEEGKPYGGDISVKHTDKRFKDRKDWKENFWDNVNWFNGLIEDNPESFPDLESSVSKEDAKLFIGALRYLKESEWF